VGNKVSALETDGDGNFIARHRYSGFPQYAVLSNIIQTKDGGYLLVGTSDLNIYDVFYSHFQILAIKTDANFNQQWLKQFNTTYPAIGVDVDNTDDGGFIIGAFEKSFNRNYRMVLIKIDENGSMQ
jgi:hypothetical protein